MNRIYKVIWSRCNNAFIVVSEIAGSRSTSSRTRNERRTGRQPLVSCLTKIAGSMALAFGLSGVAWSQTAAAPGNSVLTVTPDTPDLVLTNDTVTNTAYGNALKIETGAAGAVRVSGGTFTINPAAPTDDRAGDTAPYAGIWIETVSEESVYLQDGVQVNVTGDNLHGIHLAETYSWLSSSRTQINAQGQDSIGLFTKGTASLRQDSIIVEGENAKGISIEGGNADIQYVVMDVSGSGSITGIDVQGGHIRVAESTLAGQSSLDVTVTGDGADANATGMRLSGTLSGSDLQIDDASIIVDNTSGNETIGIHLDGVDEDQRVNFANTQIVVMGHPAAGNTSGVKIEGPNTYGAVGLDNVTLDVTGHSANGVLLLAESSSADVSGGTITVSGNGAHGIKAEAHSANIYMRDDARIIVTGDSGVGISLENEGGSQIHDTTIHVDGDNSIGFLVRNDGYVYMDSSTINVLGNESVAVQITDSNLSNIQFMLVDVSATGIDSVGVNTENSWLQLDRTTIDVNGDKSIALRADSSDVSLTNTTLTAAGDQSTGIEASGSIVSFVDSTLNVNGGALPGHGILARDSIIEMEGGSLFIEGTSSVRGILSMGDDHEVNIAGAEVDVSSTGDAWALLSDGGSLNVTDGTTVWAEGTNGAIGVYGSAANLTLSDSTVEARSVAGVARGILADFGTSLDMLNMDVLVEGGHDETIAVRLNNVQDAQIIDSFITASGTDDIRDIFALSATGNSSVVIQGTHLSASSAAPGDRTFSSAVLVEDGSSVTLADGVHITVDGGMGSGVGLVAGDLDTQVRAANVIIDVEGGYEAAGISVFDDAVVSVVASRINVIGDDDVYGFYSEGGVLDISDSDVQVRVSSGASNNNSTVGVQAVLADINISGSNFDVTADDQAAGLLAGDATVAVSDTDFQVTSNRGEASGIIVGRTVVPASLEAVRVNVTGVDGATAAGVFLSGSIVVSGDSQLVSSHDGIALIGDDGQLDISLTDTQIRAGTNSLAAQIHGEGRQRFNLGSGVVATENDGTLLNVERDHNAATGRVELNLADGAVSAGAIRDDATGLAALTADGGTYVSLDNASYTGSVQNIRAVSVTNAGRIGGGTVTAPNTVLENVSVDHGVFSGNWDIGGTLQAGNQGRVAPGNSIGVITAHTIDWGPGGIYQVEVNAAGESDRVDVTGPSRADVSHTALHVDQEGGTGGYRLDHDYTILTAAGGIDGTFNTAEWVGSELIKVNPIYAANQIDITLSVDEQTLNQASLTSNQRATSDGALSVAGLNAAADAAFLSSNPAAAFDLLSGEIHPSTRAGLMNGSVLMSNAILGRLRDRASGTAGSQVLASDVSARYPMWISYAHTEQSTRGDSNTARRKHSIDGFSLGGDAELGSGWKVGGAFTYASSKIKLNARRSSSDIDSYGLALYAGNSWERGTGTVNFMAGLGHTWHDVSTRRSVDLGGSQTLKASYDARTTQLFGEVGYAIPIGERSQLEPYLGLTWLQHRSDGFTERGGSAALKGTSGTEDTTFSTLGLRGTTTLDVGENMVRLQGGLGWRRAFGDRDPRTRLSFIEGGSSSFKVTGAPIARNTAVFDVGAEVQLGRHTTIGLGYEGQTGSGYTEHTGNLYLKARF